MKIRKIEFYFSFSSINIESLNFDKINQYRNFTGVRNEVDVLITETGHRVLGETLPKSVEDVEGYRVVAFG